MLWVCLGCGTRYAASLKACPHCGSTECRADYEEEAGEVPKITTWGGVSHPEDLAAAAALAGVVPAAPEAAPESAPAPEAAPEPPAPEPEPAAEAVPEPAVPDPAPKPKAAAPSLSRAKDAPAEITGEGGVTVPKAGAGGE